MWGSLTPTCIVFEVSVPCLRCCFETAWLFALVPHQSVAPLCITSALYFSPFMYLIRKYSNYVQMLLHLTIGSLWFLKLLQ